MTTGKTDLINNEITQVTYPQESLKLSKLVSITIDIVQKIFSSKIMFIVLGAQFIKVAYELGVHSFFKLIPISYEPIWFVISNFLIAHPMILVYLLFMIFLFLLTDNILIYSIDTYIKNQAISLKSIVRKSASKLLPSLCVDLILMISFVPLFLGMLFNDFSSNDYNLIIGCSLLLLGLLISVPLFFSRILIVIQNVTVLEALQKSIKLIGFKYYFLIMLLMLFPIITHTILKSSKLMPPHPWSSIIGSLFGILSMPIVYSIKLCLLNNIALERLNSSR